MAARVLSGSELPRSEMRAGDDSSGKMLLVAQTRSANNVRTRTSSSRENPPFRKETLGAVGLGGQTGSIFEPPARTTLTRTTSGPIFEDVGRAPKVVHRDVQPVGRDDAASDAHLHAFEIPRSAAPVPHQTTPVSSMEDRSRPESPAPVVAGQNPPLSDMRVDSSQPILPGDSVQVSPLFTIPESPLAFWSIGASSLQPPPSRTSMAVDLATPPVSPRQQQGPPPAVSSGARKSGISGAPKPFCQDPTEKPPSCAEQPRSGSLLPERGGLRALSVGVEKVSWKNPAIWQEHTTRLFGSGMALPLPGVCARFPYTWEPAHNMIGLQLAGPVTYAPPPTADGAKPLGYFHHPSHDAPRPASTGAVAYLRGSTVAVPKTERLCEGEESELLQAGYERLRVVHREGDELVLPVSEIVALMDETAGVSQRVDDKRGMVFISLEELQRLDGDHGRWVMCDNFGKEVGHKKSLVFEVKGRYVVVCVWTTTSRPETMLYR